MMSKPRCMTLRRSCQRLTWLTDPYVLSGGMSFARPLDDLAGSNELRSVTNDPPSLSV